MQSGSITITLQDALGRADQLSQILERFDTWEDPTSERIHAWGRDAIHTILTQRKAGTEAMTQLAIEKINRLAQEILCNPLSETDVLQDPVLDHGRIWERSQHAECASLFMNRSPFDGESMSSAPKTHEFAKAILDWLHMTSKEVSDSIMLSSANPDEQRQLTLLRQHPELDGLRRGYYQRMIQQALLVEQQYKMKEQLEDAFHQIDDAIDALRAKDAEVLKAAEEQAKVHEQAFQESLQHVQETHEATVEQMRGQIVDHQTEIKRLTAEMSSLRDETSARSIAQHEELLKARNEHMCALDQLEGRLATERQEGLTLANRLSDQLQRTTQRSQDTIATLERTRQGEVSDLRHMIDETTDVLGRTQTRLDEEHAQNSKNQVEIQSLHHKYASAQAQIRELQGRLADCHGGSRCLIM